MGNPRTVPIQVRLTAKEKQQFSAAADRQHLNLSSWIRLAALNAARRELPAGPWRLLDKWRNLGSPAPALSREWEDLLHKGQ